jgi:hypothetical protein
MKLHMTYRLDHDTGYAPNPFHGYLTLAHCKPDFGKTSQQVRGSKYIIPKKSWVIGTAGGRLLLEDWEYYKDTLIRLPQNSDQCCRLIYAGRVFEHLTYEEYYKDERFLAKRKSEENEIAKYGDNYVKRNLSGSVINAVLIIKPFYYFGCFAPLLPKELQDKNVIKGYGLTSGSGCKYLSDPEATIQKIISFLGEIIGSDEGLFGFPSFKNEKPYKGQAENSAYLKEIYEHYLHTKLKIQELNKAKPFRRNITLNKL